METTPLKDDLRRLWKANYLQIGLILLTVGAIAALLVAIDSLNALTMVGVTVIVLGALLLVLRRGRNAPSQAEPRTALGRWLREVHNVWSASHWDLGLVAAAGGGVWMLIARLIESFAPALEGSLSLSLLTAVPLAWAYGTAHVLAHLNTENGASTPLIDAIKPASFRFGAVVLGVLFYMALIHVAELYELLRIPESMSPLIALAGGLITAALLPYVSILMIERKTPLEALKRNIDLVAGRWGLLFVCLMLIWVGFFFVALVATSLNIGAVYASGLLATLLTDPTARQIARYSLGGVMVGAFVLLVFYALPLFVIGPVATYRMLLKEKGQRAPEPEPSAPESPEAPGSATRVDS